jgi:photosystem II stability/assembly factor-like uncharacterized protein
VLAACGYGGSGAPAPANITAVDQASGTTALLIAVSPVNERIAWASGARGTYARTTDGGATWQAAQVPGAEALQFRDVYALDENTAWLLSIGNADTSRIYRTTDAGKTWALQFTNPEPKAFYDCLDFWDARRGLALSDAVAGQTVMLSTSDGGAHWERIPPATLPAARPGEGAFAASGTCLVIRPGGHAWVALGTPQARLLHTADYGRSWSADSIPLAAISSVSFRDLAHGMVFGGDTTAASAATTDGGRSWTRGARPPFAMGFYGGAFVPNARVPTVVAAGPGGLAYSRDEGATWVTLNNNNYWGIGFAASGVGWVVGRGGRITRLSGF